jgi:hypothetical protein
LNFGVWGDVGCKERRFGVGYCTITFRGMVWLTPLEVAVTVAV